MADAPRLVTTNEPTGYAPYSVTAILAVILATLFLLILTLLGVSAFLAGQQLVEPLLLILPAGVLVLAFAGRRQILNSEGTREGLKLCNFAWWIAVLGGCGYAAYLVGRMIGVQSDSKDALISFIETLKKADPVDTRNMDFHKAFVLTIDTGRQQSVEVKAVKDIEAAQKGFFEDTPNTIGVTRFRQTDLVRIMHRNRDYNPQFTFDGLQSWEQDVSGLRCKGAGTLRTPEGDFKLNFDMMQPTQDKPRWRIVAPSQGFVAGAQVTKYGEMIADMEATGRFLVISSLLPSIQYQPQRRAVLPAEFLQRTGDHLYRYPLLALGQDALIGSLSTVKPEQPGYETLIKSQLFVPISREDSGKDGDPREKFYAAWKEGVLAAPGFILKDSPDQAPITTVTEKSVEMRVPIEIQLPRMESSQQAARGAVVLVCDDPTFMAKLNDLRRTSATDARTEMTAPKFVAGMPWKLKAIESDMKLLTAPKSKMNPEGMNPGMGG